MFKRILATLGMCALCAIPAITAHAAVYVEDVNGNVQEYDSVPALTISTGDVVQTFFYYAADSNGEWEDNIIYRVDITND